MVGMSKAKAEPRSLPKRFYKDATAEQGAGGYQILLDGKVLKTQARNALVITQPALAEAVVDEWRAQQTHVDPDLMPLTRLVNITIDRIPLDRLALIEQLCAYGETDLICYRDAQPQLRARQAQHFDPLIAWAHDALGIELAVTDGVMPVAQSTASLHRLYEILAAATDAELAALGMLVPLVGSAIIALALWKEQITLDDALIAVRLDEDFQAEQWGIDHEVVAAWEGKRRDIRASGFFLTCK